MRQYIIQIDNYRPGREIYDFRLLHHQECIFSLIDTCLVPGMNAVHARIMEAMSEDPLE